jgi:hypothetical protein
VVASQLKRAAAGARRGQVAHGGVLVVLKNKLTIESRHQTNNLERF